MAQQKFWVVSEQRNLLTELIHGVKTSAQGKVFVNAVALGNAQAVNTAVLVGADRVYSFRLNEGEQVESCYRRLAQLIRDEGADLVLVGATKRGKTLGALLAAELESGLATEAVVREWNEGAVTAERLMFGGLAVNTDTFVSGIPIITVPPRTWECPAAAVSPAAAEVDETTVVAVAGEKSPVHIIEQRPRESSSANLDEAQVVITIGRGVKKREDLVMFEELAAPLEGVLACTRPVAEEEGYRWFPEDSYIGISGRKVKPRLYISVGSSGQIQHLAGCRDAKVIVAIDKNEDAPIFEASDYGIVGDLYQVIPELMKKIKEIKSA